MFFTNGKAARSSHSILRVGHLRALLVVLVIHGAQEITSRLLAQGGAGCAQKTHTRHQWLTGRMADGSQDPPALATGLRDR